MKRFAWAVLGTILAAGAASAQYRPGGYPGGMGRPGMRPTTSPYLNLLGRGNPAANYYGIVRPQQMMNNMMFGMQGGQAPGFGSQDPDDPEAQRATGHGVTFNYLGHYYNNNPAVPSMGGQGGGMGGSTQFNNIGGAAMGGFGGGMNNRPGGGNLGGNRFGNTSGGFGNFRR